MVNICKTIKASFSYCNYCRIAEIPNPRPWLVTLYRGVEVRILPGIVSVVLWFFNDNYNKIIKFSRIFGRATIEQLVAPAEQTSCSRFSGSAERDVSHRR